MGIRKYPFFIYVFLEVWRHRCHAGKKLRTFRFGYVGDGVKRRENQRSCELEYVTDKPYIALRIL